MWSGCALLTLLLLLAPAPSLAPPVSQSPAQATPPPAQAGPTPPPTLVPPGKRVGLQVGHWQAGSLPDEQGHLRLNNGQSFNGVNERDLNRALVSAIAAKLTAQGFRVDILPATVPVGYTADAFIAIHCDFASDPAIRGYKVGLPWRASVASLALRDALDRTFAQTEQPFHNAVNSTMRGYYAFNYLRYDHAITPATPAVIIEAGFITNPLDFTLLTAGQAELAETISAGISDFLRLPLTAADRDPPALPLVTPLAALDVLYDPDPAAALLATVQPGDLLWTYEAAAGWYHVVLPPEWDYIGWVPIDAVTPLPADAWRSYTE
jgi:N-acetylmuramoyl-L-alanine amidase